MKEVNWKDYLNFVKNNNIKSLVIIGSSKYTKEEKEKLNEIIKKVYENYDYFVVLPDKGLYFEFAKKLSNYLNENQKLALTIPKEDKVFGIEHLIPQIEEIKNLYKNAIEINTGNWFVQDLVIGTLGDILFLKRSSGSYGELWYGAYLSKFFWDKKRKLIIPLDTFGEKLSNEEEKLLGEYFDIIYI
jgi:vacuolar-type H+-ATPase subunit F/Vma7